MSLVPGRQSLSQVCVKCVAGNPAGGPEQEQERELRCWKEKVERPLANGGGGGEIKSPDAPAGARSYKFSITGLPPNPEQKDKANSDPPDIGSFRFCH